MKLLHAPRVKSKAGSPKKNKPTEAMEVKVAINASGAKGSLGL
jgi:hypothetical protein